jgi:hypothetical protein
MQNCCVNLPFLNLNYINPVCLLTTDRDYSQAQTIAQLCPDQLPVQAEETNTATNNGSTTSATATTTPAPPITVHGIQLKEVNLSPALGNLVRTLHYHKQQHDGVPMSAKELEQNTRIVTELSSTLKTIFQL